MRESRGETSEVSHGSAEPPKIKDCLSFAGSVIKTPGVNGRRRRPYHYEQGEGRRGFDILGMGLGCQSEMKSSS